MRWNLRRARSARVALLAAATLGASVHAEELPASPTVAVVNVAETDFARIVRDQWLVGGRRTIEGTAEQPKRGVQDMHYRAVLTHPAIALADGGLVALRFHLEEAELRVASFERRLLGARAHCEDLRVSLDPETVVAAEFGLRVGLEGGALHVTPERFDFAGLEDAIRIERSLRCGHAWIPDWLLRAAGRSRVRRTFGRLDDSLLARAREEASRIDEAGGLLRLDPDKIALRPQQLDTGHHALWLGFASGSPPEDLAPSPIEVESIGPSADRSFVALSPEIGRRILRDAVGRADGRPRAPSAEFRRLVRSDAFVALFPGLTRDRDRLRFAVRFESAPSFEFVETRSAATGSAYPGVRVDLSGLALDLFEAGAADPTLLGSVKVRQGRLTLHPFVGPRGGLSMEVVDNDWRLEGRGIEIAEEVFAATLQELVFAEAFETTFEPLGRALLATGAGPISLGPFEVREGWLVVGIRLASDSPPVRAGQSVANPISARAGR